MELAVLIRPPCEILGVQRSASIDYRQCDQTIKTRRAMVSSRSVPYRCPKTQIAPSVRHRIPSSASHAPVQFRMEFGANRSDDVCGIILGEAADEKHLISQRQARCDVLWKHCAGSRPCKGWEFLIIGCAYNGGYSWILLACVVNNTLNRMASIKRDNDEARTGDAGGSRRPPCVPPFSPCESESGRTRLQCKEPLRPRARATPAGPRVHNRTGLRDP